MALSQTEKLIPLVKRDGTVVTHVRVDVEDHYAVSTWTWNAQTSHNGDVYAVRWQHTYERVPGWGITKRTVHISMAREILGLPRGDGWDVVADHISGDTLDNRRSNLRAVNQSQNIANRRNHPLSNNRAGILGVCWHTDRAVWQVHVKIDGRQIYLGYYSDLDYAGQIALAGRSLVHGIPGHCDAMLGPATPAKVVRDLAQQMVALRLGEAAA